MKDRDKFGRFLKGHILTPKGTHISINTEFKEGHKHSDNELKKILKNRYSKWEKIFSQLLKENNLPYEFVGNGKLIIDGRCPDYVNCNGEKKLIELSKITLLSWKKKTREHYAKYGFKTLFIDKRIFKRNLYKAIKMVKKFENE